MEELRTYVLYDIEDDRIRNRIAETCKDYGLARIQYSAFSGLLNRNKRSELFVRLSVALGEKPGKILVLPVCEKDARDGRQIKNEPAERRNVSLQGPILKEEDAGGEGGNPASGE